MSENWHYVLQSDYVTTEPGRPATGNDYQDVGVNQYLFYTLNDCWELGGRAGMVEVERRRLRRGRTRQLPGSHGRHQLQAACEPRGSSGNSLQLDERKSPANGTDDFNNTVFGVDAVVTF